MPAKESEPITRAHIWIYSSDWEELKELFGSTIGPSKAVRQMVRTMLRQLKHRASSVNEARAEIINEIAREEEGDDGDILAGVQPAGGSGPEEP